jgi:hypothetical protein
MRFERVKISLNGWRVYQCHELNPGFFILGIDD